MAEMSEELKASMGKPSSFHTGSGGQPSAPAPEPEHNPEHVKSLVDSLKGLLGIGANKESVHNGKSVTDIVDEAARGAPTTPEYGE